MTRLPLFVFRVPPKKCGVPLRADRPLLLKWNSRHMTSFAEETVDYLLRSVSFKNNFHWIWLGLGHCCFVSDSYAYSHDSPPMSLLTTSFKAHPTYFSNISLHQSTRTLFLTIVKLCGLQLEQIFLLQPGVHAISNVCWW